MHHLFKFVVTLCLGVGATSATAKDYRGAEFLSWQTFKFGAFEARIQAAPGGGIITPFFLIKDDSWKQGQEWEEIDFEIFGRQGGTHFQTQVMGPGNPRVEHIKEYDAHVDLTKAYHTYRIEWTPQRIAFLYDGKLVREETDWNEYGKYFDPNRAEPMRLRTSVWGGNTHWTGVFDRGAVPSQAYVKYIAYERYTPGRGPNGRDFTPDWTERFERFDYSKWYLANWDFEYAVSVYAPENAAVRDRALVLSFTRNDQAVPWGAVPRDVPPTAPSPWPTQVQVPTQGDSTPN